MPITYTNRKGRTYYLCLSTTKTGKPCYYFSREPTDNKLAEAIPPGYQIQESVNGIVSLAKAGRLLISEEEINSVKKAVEKHPKARHYRVDVKSKQITIYEHVGPDLMELAPILAADLGIGRTLDKEMVHRLQEEERIYGQFTPIMRFILTDDDKRLFRTERMCFLGRIDDWIGIAYDKPITKLAPVLIPKLGTDEFFELF